MEAKRFTAGDMRRALQMVREHLGPDAVILSSRKNLDGVEVVATTDFLVEDEIAEAENEIASIAHKKYRQLMGVLDTDVPVDKQKDNLKLDPKIKNDRTSISKKTVDEAEGGARKIPSMPKANPVAINSKSPVLSPEVQEKPVSADGRLFSVPEDEFIDEPEIDGDYFKKRRQWDLQVYKKSVSNINQEVTQDITKMRSEIDALRSMLSTYSGHAAVPGVIPVGNESSTELKKRLEMMGIPASQFDYFLKSVNPSASVKSAWRDILKNIQSQIKMASHDLVNAGGVFAFVGPTGAGKTTTIAKLATRYAMQHGIEQVGLISLDTQRVGGTQQLKTMSKLLGIPVRMVDTAAELEVSLRVFRARSLILIDTAGVRPGSPEMNQLLKMLKVDKVIQSFLVLPTTCQYPVMKTQLHCYQEVVKGLVITKLDEAISLGETFATLIDSQLPVVYTTDGQLIPENIALPNSTGLMSLAVEKIRIQQAESRGLAKDFNKKNFAVSDLYSK